MPKKINKILIVEDENELRSLYKLLISRLPDIEIVEASDGMMALDLISKSKKAFDLVLLDEMIPKLQGSQLLEKLKNIDTAPLKILMMTNLDEEAITSKIDRANYNRVVGFIIKSNLTPTEFTEKIKEILNLK